MRLYSMSEWILSICALGLITSLICVILPHGNVSTLIKSVLSLLMLFAIVNPIISFDFNNIDVGNIVSSDIEIDLQQNYIDYVNEKKIKLIKNDCLIILKKYGVNESNVDIDYSVDNNLISIKHVNIKIVNSELNLDKEHTYIIENIKKTIADYLKINKDNIAIYG